MVIPTKLSHEVLLPNLPFVLCQKNGDWIIVVRLQPSAKHTEIVGVQEGKLKIRISAQPIENKANIALVEFLAKTLCVSKSKISLIKGTASREKKLLISSDSSPDWSKLAAL